jgi:hypothetical protein
MGFTRDDFDALSALVLDTWTSARDLDWSVPAGAVEWTCRRTGAHVVDCVFSYALFLGSRKRDGYPNFGELRALPGFTPDDLVDGLRAVTTMLSAVIATVPPDTRAVLWRRPQVELGAPDDFAARGGLELAIHAHDIASGLSVTFEPPAPLCTRLFQTTTRWPGNVGFDPTGDAWADLVQRSGRPSPR